MKNTLLVLLSLIMIVSCSVKEVTADKIVEREGLFYEINTVTPFTGLIVGNNEQGEMVFRNSVKKGIFEGPSEYFHDNGQVMFKDNYYQGKLHGPTKGFDENGVLDLEGVYENGKPIGVWFEYREDGSLYVKRTFNENELNKRESFHENGTKWEVEYWKGDSISPYIYGEQSPREGEYLVYHDNGAIKVRGKYINGEQEGMREEFFSNGKISSLGKFINGKKDGLHYSYYRNEQLSDTGNYKNGVKTGEHYRYYYNSQLAKYEDWRNGKVTKSKCSNPEGKKINCGFVGTELLNDTIDRLKKR